MERRVRLDSGHFHLVSLRNKLTGGECQDAGAPPAEFRFLANGEDVSGSGWHWKLRNEHGVPGIAGRAQLDIELDSASIHITKHYVIYPGTSVIREWLTLENISGKPVRIKRVEFLHTRVLGSIAQDLQFNYLTGGGNYNGSQYSKPSPRAMSTSARSIQMGPAWQLQQFPVSCFSAQSK